MKPSCILLNHSNLQKLQDLVNMYLSEGYEMQFAYGLQNQVVQPVGTYFDPQRETVHFVWMVKR